MNGDDRDRVAAEFGVTAEQVERDRLISHLLAYVSRHFVDQVHFIGGTALARTHLPNGRLSEDVDLIAVDDRRAIAAQFDCELPRALARTHGRLAIEPMLSDVADTASVVLRTTSGVTVKVQLLSSRNRVRWPVERRELVQRYRDAPAAELFVPTLPASVAAKTATWADRHAARDLWDLWALNEINAIGAAAGQLYRRYGPTGRLPGHYVFATPPSEAEWRAQLAGQTRLTVTAAEALNAVRDAWARVAAQRG